MADSLQLDGAVLKLTNKSEVNISKIDINSHELVNENQIKCYCDKIERCETQKSENILSESTSKICILPSQSLSSSSPSSLSLSISSSVMSPSIQIETAKKQLNGIINNKNELKNDISEIQKSVQHVGLTKVKNFQQQQQQQKHHHQQQQQQQEHAKKILLPPPPIMDLQEIEDLRKKRCADRYDSSESSDR